MDYWRECIEEAFEDAGLKASKEQIDTVASWAEGAHDNYGMATGLDIASQNLRANREREMDDLRKELQAERDKVTCRVCGGGGTITTHGPIHSSYSSCLKCNGAGRHAPGH